MRSLTLIAAAGAFALTACGGGTPAENRAEALDEAAEYSTPEAANVLENQADRTRDGNVADPAAVRTPCRRRATLRRAPPIANRPPAASLRRIAALRRCAWRNRDRFRFVRRSPSHALKME
jgi:hypothetical protein